MEENVQNIVCLLKNLLFKSPWRIRHIIKFCLFILIERSNWRVEFVKRTVNILAHRPCLAELLATTARAFAVKGIIW